MCFLNRSAVFLYNWKRSRWKAVTDELSSLSTPQVKGTGFWAKRREEVALRTIEHAENRSSWGRTWNNVQPCQVKSKFFHAAKEGLSATTRWIWAKAEKSNWIWIKERWKDTGVRKAIRGIVKCTAVSDLFWTPTWLYHYALYSFALLQSLCGWA